MLRCGNRVTLEGQTTVWKINYKLVQMMMKGDATKPLSGRIEREDAYVGGECTGGKRGYGAVDKTPFVVVVETTFESKPVRLKLWWVVSFCDHSISIFAECSLNSACTVVNDGLACFGAVADAGCVHQVTEAASGAATARISTFKWVNTALGSFKTVCVGTRRAMDQNHVTHYQTKFEYRSDRRFDLAIMTPQLLWVGVRTTPMLCWTFKLANVYA